MLQIIKTPQAKRDLIACAGYIADTNVRSSDSFLRAAEEAFRKLAEMPGMGSPRDYDNPRLTGMRMWPVRRFRAYLIFYRVQDDKLEIIRVLHGAQNLAEIFAPEA